MTQETLAKANQIQNRLNECQDILDVLKTMTRYATCTLRQASVGSVELTGELKNYVIDYLRGKYQEQMEELVNELKCL